LIVKIEIPEEDYQNLPREVRDRCKVLGVDDPDYDYSENESWQQLKKESNKAFKLLKQHEFKMRNP